MPSTPRYGIDAPGVIRNFFMGAAGVAFAGWLLPKLPRLRAHAGVTRGPLVALAGVNGAFGVSMLAYGLRGKFNHRAQLLRMIPWRGDEQVLDVGTGRGFLAVGAARHLTTGHVTGIDSWQAADLTGNTPESARHNARHNARLEGVADRVTFEQQSASSLRYPGDSFDVVLSLLCLHNIEPEADRRTACREIARVLKPGGTALLSDYTGTNDYAAELARAGLRVPAPKSYLRQSHGLMWMVVATKPA